jgi:protein ImuB
MRVLCIYFLSGIEKNNSLEKIAEACLRFSPLIAIGQRAIFLEIGACRKLYTEESVSLRIQILMQRFLCQVQVAIADDIPTALAFAKYGVLDKSELPVESLKLYASPFRPQKHLDSVVLLLQRLGIYTLKDILAIPRNSIPSHLGKDTSLALQSIDNAKLMPWPQWKLVEKIFESENISEEFHILDMEPLLFLLRSMLDKILLRLKGRAELLSTVEICIEQEQFSTVKEVKRKWQIDFAFPQGSVLSVLPIVRDRLNSSFEKLALESSVRRLEIRVLKSVRSFNKQRDFFSKREEELESFQSIVSRLIERLGRERTFVASPVESYYPERSWKKSLDEQATANVVQSTAAKIDSKFASINVLMPDGLTYCQEANERPLRVLKQALALQKRDNFYSLGNRCWQVKESYGPERLSGEWWLQTLDTQRDYYRVLTETGEELWVYLQKHTGQFFLQGFFD